MNTAPKFGKIELLQRSTKHPEDFGSITKLEFLDCGMVISGDYLIIVMDERNELNNSLTTTGKIFPLNKIAAYKTYAS